MIVLMIVFLSFVTGFLHMVRGRGLSDGDGIVDLTGKLFMFTIIAGIMYFTLKNWVPAVSFFVGFTCFWVKTGEFMRVIYGNGKKLWQYILYCLGYNLSLMPGFILLGSMMNYYGHPVWPILAGAVLSFAWPFLIYPLRNASPKWKQWATAEFIIGAWVSLTILWAWAQSFLQ